MEETTEVPPLTDAEILQLRAELAQSEKVRWLWATVRVWLAWIAASFAVLVWAKDILKAGLKRWLE